jgi:hypothetical protein
MPRRSVREALTYSQPPLGPHSQSVEHDARGVPKTALDVRQQIRESLGVPSLPEAQPTVPSEGHVCEWPLWAFSKKQSTVTRLRIDYEDGTYFQLKAPEGMPGVLSPGYLDVLWY